MLRLISALIEAGTAAGRVSPTLCERGDGLAAAILDRLSIWRLVGILTRQPTQAKTHLLQTLAGVGSKRGYRRRIKIGYSSILVSLGEVSPFTSAIFRCLYALPCLLFFAVREQRRHGSRSWRERRYALAAGVFIAADLILWHHAIADVGAGLSTMLANIQVLILPFVAWALGSERPPRRP